MTGLEDEISSREIVVFFDNTILDLFGSSQLDWKILEDTRHLFGPVVITEGVESTALGRDYGHPYGDMMRFLANTWERVRRTNDRIDLFERNRTRNTAFVKRALNCFHPGTSSEDVEMCASAKTLSDFGWKSAIVSDDKHILSYFHFVSNYYGACLRILSTYELLANLGRVANQQYIHQYNEYFNHGMELEYLLEEERIGNCNRFKNEILTCLSRGILGIHPYLLRRDLRLVKPRR